MAGDQLGDFSQQFNARDLSPPARIALATGPAASALWDRGWFLFPNPVYGPWDRLGCDDLLPSVNQWEPKRCPVKQRAIHTTNTTRAPQRRFVNAIMTTF